MRFSPKKREASGRRDRRQAAARECGLHLQSGDFDRIGGLDGRVPVRFGSRVRPSGAGTTSVVATSPSPRLEESMRAADSRVKRG
jgi:hypothetical protein